MTDDLLPYPAALQVSIESYKAQLAEVKLMDVSLSLALGNGQRYETLKREVEAVWTSNKLRRRFLELKIKQLEEIGLRKLEESAK